LYVFYEGARAAGINLNDEKFGILYGNHIYIVRELIVKLIKSTSKLLIVALALSVLANVALLLYIAILKAEYSWVRNTYEADIVGAYENDGRLTATIEHLENRPKEYTLDSSPPLMGIAVENFYSYKQATIGNTDLIRLLMRVFDKSQKPEPERIWHTELKNRWLEAFVREHNATLSRLRSDKP
jgi:hypothetical protein